MSWYLALETLDNKEIGKYFNISSSAVSKVAGNMERKMAENKKVRKEVEQLLSTFSA